MRVPHSGPLALGGERGHKTGAPSSYTKLKHGVQSRCPFETMYWLWLQEEGRVMTRCSSMRNTPASTTTARATAAGAFHFLAVGKRKKLTKLHQLLQRFPDKFMAKARQTLACRITGALYTAMGAIHQRVAWCVLILQYTAHVMCASHAPVVSKTTHGICVSTNFLCLWCSTCRLAPGRRGVDQPIRLPHVLNFSCN